jgi:hypothetical protein
MTPEVTKTGLNKIILTVWIENGPILLYGPGIELAFRSNSYVYRIRIYFENILLKLKMQRSILEKVVPEITVTIEQIALIKVDCSGKRPSVLRKI